MNTSDLSRRALLGTGARLAAGLAAFPIIGCGEAVRSSPDATSTPARRGELTAVSLALDWVPNTNHTGFFVAEQRGWYADEGIRLEVLPYSGTTADTLVAGGRANFGISFQHALTFARASGLPNISVMAILQHASSAIAVHADRDDIRSPADLDGKVYAGFGTPTEVPILTEVIRRAGGRGDFDVVTLQTAAYEALYAGDVDFTIMFATWEGIEAELRNQPVKLMRYQDYDFPDFYQVVLAASEEMLERDADLARRFVRASRRGFEYAMREPDEAAQILIDANEEVFTLPELVVRSARLLASDYYGDADGRFGMQSLERWAPYSRFLFEAGILTDGDGRPVTEEPDWADYFTNGLIA